MKPFLQPILIILAAGAVISCAGPGQVLTVGEPAVTFSPGDIIDTHKKRVVTFEALVTDLASVQVVYVGERHTDPAHHRIQLQIIEALIESDRPLAVGMEMFDTTYAPVLSAWSAGELDREAFIEKTHWYANWGYDFSLYSGILETIKEHGLALVGLNIPFHIPAKIAAGGIDSLLCPDRRFVPKEVDLDDPGHRAYLEKIFSLHPMPQRSNFDYFYEAQCVWEEAMAQSVAEALADRRMVVIAGNGHIAKKFGIPNRVFRRTGAAFRTVIPAPAGDTGEWDDGDYIWVTAP